MTDSMETPGMGWLADSPDIRDYSFEQDTVALKFKALGQKDSIHEMLNKVGVAETKKMTLAPSMDLRAWCSPIEDQKNLGSCTAQAGVGLLEYFERRAFGKHIDAARLFLYKVTRNLMHVTGDTGAYLRTTMKAMTLFGVLPEEYWQYVVADFDKEPQAFCYAFAQSYQSVSYYRLDPPGTSKDELLTRIKTYIAKGLPSMFGFTVYSSYTQAGGTGGKIPMPTLGEGIVGGHAVVAVGYDDNMKIKNTNPGGTETTGAFLIRNSWGIAWGDHGYGWLPYDYVSKGLAVDWWSLLRNEWVDTGNFG